MQLRLNNKQGFTLIEVLLSTVLLAMILGAIYSMYVYVSASYLAGNYVLDLQRQGYRALEEITRDLKEADLVTLTDTSGNGIDNRIDARLKVDETDGIANLIEADYWMTQAGDLVRYLRWADDTGATTSDVTETLIDAATMDRVEVDSLEFDYDGDSLVTVRLRLRLNFTEQASGGPVLLKKDDDCLGEDCIELYTNVFLRNVDT